MRLGEEERVECAEMGRLRRRATIWIPNIHDPAYRARLDAACRELASLTPADADAAAGRADIFRHTAGWQ